MKLQDVLNWFSAAGIPLSWRLEPNVENRQAILRPPAGTSLDLGDIEVAIVVPDVHLGCGNDVFSEGDPKGPRTAQFLKFLTALAQLRDHVGVDKFRAVQVGDWYDFYRAPALTLQEQVNAIERQYADICDAARAIPLCHAIGNHDAALFKNPSVTQSKFGIAQPVGHFGMPAYHGHDSKTLQTLEDPDRAAEIALNIVDLIACIPILGKIVDFIERIVDDSFSEPWLDGGQDKPWPPYQGQGIKGWGAPWIARSDASELVRAGRCIEYASDIPISVAFVGHSHRPGISCAWITAERQVALVDAGSWTYGRGEIAIVARDGVGLASLPKI